MASFTEPAVDIGLERKPTLYPQVTLRIRATYCNTHYYMCTSHSHKSSAPSNPFHDTAHNVAPVPEPEPEPKGSVVVLDGAVEVEAPPVAITLITVFIVPVAELLLLAVRLPVNCIPRAGTNLDMKCSCREDPFLVRRVPITQILSPRLETHSRRSSACEGYFVEAPELLLV